MVTDDVNVTTTLEPSPDYDLYNDSCLDWVNDDPGIEKWNFFRFVTNGILLNVIGCFGILGNLISMIILSRPQMRSSINYLLIGLARIDTVLIITSILLFGLPGIYPYSKHLFLYYFRVYPHIAPFVYPLATVMQTASVYLTMTVSLERYVAVCHPLRARSLCTYGRARTYVIAIVIFSTMYNAPRLWEGEIKSEWSDTFNMTVYCPIQSAFRDNELYQTIYIHWLYLICMYLLPFISLAVLNGAIYRQVLKANRERQRLSRLQQREIGLATMLMCVVAVFFVCNLLPMVINIVETFKIPTEDVFDITMMINLSNLLVTINSSVNFIIYVIFGEKFQRLFLVLFCHNSLFFPGRESPDGATHDDSFVSNGDRSFRLQRQGTSISRNGSRHSGRMNGTSDSRKSGKTPSPGPCVYYPINRTNKEVSTYTTQTLMPE
ncbi:FMRFamide receptor [Cylas formicarius]|uniref:FMRFamide receptor n=1 Tax=Cylas formicarius TaxID=197179 RepID=UPI00295836E2|nr:FMRFamide receptor [Cylas formicarius]XP_060526785.1 FMRFamide receptor [Cylas formicarius]